MMVTRTVLMAQMKGAVMHTQLQPVIIISHKFHHTDWHLKNLSDTKLLIFL